MTSALHARTGTLVCLVAASLVLASPVIFGALRAQAALQVAAGDVRAAEPLVEAYGADHGSFRGLTVETLRHDAPEVEVSHVVVLDGGGRYCIDRRINRSVASLQGPGGQIRRGRACPTST
jgi:hypothetical protein